MSRDEKHFDVVVVGAGFGGMYALHALRALDLDVKVIEAASDVGGTWYWNRYPGARCDVPSLDYSFGFSPELEQEWDWPEVFSAQPDILRYANHVADRFDLRRDIQFNTRVTGVTFDEQHKCWRLETNTGEEISCQFCIMATGCLSMPNKPDLPGADSFAGLELHTGSWPDEEFDFTEKRVGIIGTGSSGVQAIPELAKMSAHLAVFQRSPVYTVPANRKPMRPEIQNAFKENYRVLREIQQNSHDGISNFNPIRYVPDQSVQARPTVPPSNILPLTPEERRQRIMDRGVGELLNFRDVYTNAEANEIANELYREFVRYMVDDPETAEGLVPKHYGLGCKRQVLDRNYYATFNLPNVNLVNLRADPIQEIVPDGIRTASRLHELDVLVYATGFDAMTGALLRANITGRGGRKLRDKWAYGPQAYLGLQMQGFPNLFTITGPGSPSVLCNVIVAIEHHVNWIADCIAHMRERGFESIEPTEAAEVEWVQHVNDVAEGTMYTAPSCNSWYLGANISGKPRIFMPYVGGFPSYRERCDEIVAEGYAGFELG